MASLVHCHNWQAPGIIPPPGLCSGGLAFGTILHWLDSWSLGRGERPWSRSIHLPPIHPGAHTLYINVSRAPAPKQSFPSSSICNFLVRPDIAWAVSFIPSLFEESIVSFLCSRGAAGSRIHGSAFSLSLRPLTTCPRPPPRLVLDLQSRHCSLCRLRPFIVSSYRVP